jgi:diphosphomevalonate decarboxylase
MVKDPDSVEALKSGEVSWQSPSNIALIKYWGKKGFQLPANPSLSITLSKSYTETTVAFKPANAWGNPQINFFFEGDKNEAFAKKIRSYFENIRDELPFIQQLDFEIYSHNTFPHSAGIASSASAMSALALCLCSIEKILSGSKENEGPDFFTRASHFARIGSGSASRSVFGQLASWGLSADIPKSSDLVATPFQHQINPIFKNFQDSILLVSKGEKKVSSTAGHGLMNGNPFAPARYKQASANLGEILKAIETGDIDKFIQIVESEALTLHGMMMSSTPGYMLMEPNTIEIIKKIQELREQSGAKLCFTLDAGPNVHVLYPKVEQKRVTEFIESNLQQHCADGQWINDEMGNGPKRLK